jgi:four helix bundle protein
VSIVSYTPLPQRTKAFALRIIKACLFLDEGSSGLLRTLSKQLLRSGTSIGANCRESIGAQSHRDYIHKLEISLKECHETQYWLELLIESNLVEIERFQYLLEEAIEIGKILTTITRKLKNKS